MKKYIQAIPLCMLFLVSFSMATFCSCPTAQLPTGAVLGTGQLTNTGTTPAPTPTAHSPPARSFF
jgi:hypothetical protein